MFIEERAAEDLALIRLLDAAFAELVARYGLEGRSGVGPGAHYLVAVVDDETVGCVAVQTTEVAGTGEVKRMYVAPAARGQGVARALLKEIELRAADLGYDRLRLVTGHLQPAAIALYESSGYQRTEPYGTYADRPGTFCYAKSLTG
ncbi:N-acetyltransferase [Streptomyces sp. 8K308]|uniref:GNAT family N-acetyltransferase n=1 Tax=Streptomyces sp. 8K308 TaxID=2530388 RepID=UPI00104EE218|nr:GNAT family N-acetyltransferase [Streptomyces sp. 8K308]TDC26981.1 N-acetyltransferase [Streptomyces sp. 8K308]